MSKRTITGVVSSIAGDKTIVITRTTRKTHPLYGKKFTRSSKFHAHDEKNEAHVGDTVLIEECPPKSATKTWTLKQIIEKGQERLTLKENEIVEEMAEKAAAKHADKDDEVSAEEEKASDKKEAAK
jgi:small subunit ribosomal protein S17